MWREFILFMGFFMTATTVCAVPDHDRVDPTNDPGDPSVQAASLERGRVTRISTETLPARTYYLYLPQRIKQPARLLVSVHGISRNAREHAKRFSAYAEREGVILMAPLFGRKQFQGYQRLSDKNAAGIRPDMVLDAMVADVHSRLGLQQARLYLFGFSGGGQFVHRYVMAHPDKVERAVIGAAGWYTFPDTTVSYPRGLRKSARRSFETAWPEFLRVPLTVLVGERDIQRDDALNQSKRIDRQQGRNRLERGHRWINAMTAAAREQGFDTRYGFELLENTGHDFTAAMTTGQMGESVFRHLFDGEDPPIFCPDCSQAASVEPGPMLQPGASL